MGRNECDSRLYVCVTLRPAGKESHPPNHLWRIEPISTAKAKNRKSGNNGMQSLTELGNDRLDNDHWHLNRHPKGFCQAPVSFCFTVRRLSACFGASVASVSMKYGPLEIMVPTPATDKCILTQRSFLADDCGCRCTFAVVWCGQAMRKV